MRARFLSGLGGSVPAIGEGFSRIVGKLRSADSLKGFTTQLAPLLGPAVGPIVGGFVTENVDWRWLFHLTSMLDASIQLLGLVFLSETYAPKILSAKANRVRKETGNQSLRTPYEQIDQPASEIMFTSLTRPFRLLGIQVIIQIFALYLAYLHGLMYLALSTFSSLWVTRYNESISIAGLNYISIGLGFFFGTQICAPINDRVSHCCTFSGICEDPSPSTASFPPFGLTPHYTLILEDFIYRFTASSSVAMETLVCLNSVLP